MLSKTLCDTTESTPSRVTSYQIRVSKIQSLSWLQKVAVTGSGRHGEALVKTRVAGVSVDRRLYTGTLKDPGSHHRAHNERAVAEDASPEWGAGSGRRVGGMSYIYF